MEIRLPQTHVYLVNPSIDFESAKQQAFDKRVGVVAGGLGGLLSRPKPDDVGAGAAVARIRDSRFEMTPGTEQRELVAIMFTDMVGSTALKQQLGDKAGLQTIQEHHELVRQTLREFAGAREVETAGDSFFLTFPAPSAAVSFALVLQERLRQFNRGRAVPVQDRVGIHSGEVSLLTVEAGLKPGGLHVDLCARVMSLAQGGQILMTRFVFDHPRQSLKGEEIAGVERMHWLTHGAFRLKGIDESVEICDGVPAEAPLNDEIARLADSPRVVNAARELPIPRLLALQEHAAGMVSVDTGPAHSAAALGCPLVVLFGDAKIERYAPRSPTGAVQVVAARHAGDGVSGICVPDVVSAWDRLRETTAA